MYETVEAEIIHLGTDGSFMLWPVPLPDEISEMEIVASEQRPFTTLPQGAEVTHYDHDVPRHMFRRVDAPSR